MTIPFLVAAVVGIFFLVDILRTPNKPRVSAARKQLEDAFLKKGESHD